MTIAIKSFCLCNVNDRKKAKRKSHHANPIAEIGPQIALGVQSCLLQALERRLILAAELDDSERTLVYLIPRTAIIGAVLLTGYLGGAIATHVRLSDPLFSHVLFPVYLAVLLWGGLYLRDARLSRVLASR